MNRIGQEFGELQEIDIIHELSSSLFSSPSPFGEGRGEVFKFCYLLLAVGCVEAGMIRDQNVVDHRPDDGAKMLLVINQAAVNSARVIINDIACYKIWFNFANKV
jgi:hypothetical protein